MVLKGAENAAAGQDFIAFASAPENMIKLLATIAYGLPNTEAAAMVDPKYAADLPTAPANIAEAIPLDVDFWIDSSEELTRRFNAWRTR